MIFSKQSTDIVKHACIGYLGVTLLKGIRPVYIVINVILANSHIVHFDAFKLTYDAFKNGDLITPKHTSAYLIPNIKYIPDYGLDFLKPYNGSCDTSSLSFHFTVEENEQLLAVGKVKLGFERRMLVSILQTFDWKEFA